ncbi:DUF882 domain-containing protein [Phenylobacterium sp.]|uniref:DUF882 domain-containing protein n=1 Tax=Phenylobacterium sp. TaxID=1871053 RepID=UPI0035B4CB1C
MLTHRRDLLKGALGAASLAAIAGPAFATAPARSLSLLNLHTGEKLNATFWEAGQYLPDALQAMNHLLRDFRTGDVHPIAPGLLDLVSALSHKFEAAGSVQVISGYRSPKTNAALHARSDGVATHSLHMQGQAMDIRMPGVQLADLRKGALDMKRGGVGYYPSSNFVHVDIGRVRQW